MIQKSGCSYCIIRFPNGFNYDSINCQFVLQLLIMLPFSISTGLTLVSPCLHWPETCFSPQGYKAQWRDLDLLTFTNTGQQSYLHKLAQRRKEPFTAESCAEE